jgi:NDP-4-keto-2,6-dideoxyhexose 3-C-methyltransferase
MVDILKSCRICGGVEFESVMSLGHQIMTGTFPKSKDEYVTGGEVDLIRCSSNDGCGLVQLKQSYDLSKMYGMNYGYRSGLNASMVTHLHSKVDKILSLNFLNKGDIVLDIGSNDATTLKRYPQNEYQLVGIDPTGIKFSSYYPPEIRLVPEFFSADAVFKATQGNKAKVITSFSMFYDLEDPIAFAKEIESALDVDGVWIFEQSYMPTMLKTNSFDTICHEHLDFYTLTQINWILKEADLKVLNVEFNDINGGSFSVTAALVDSTHPVNDEVIANILNAERFLCLDKKATYEGFKSRVAVEQDAFLTFLRESKAAGKRVCGLGASTKGNVLLQYYGITPDLISEIGEVNPDKFGSYTPGTLIPLVPEADLLDKNPDYLVILPWHFREFFLKLPALKGRALVFPLPNFEIVQL